MIDETLRDRVAAAVSAAGGDATLVTLEPPRDPRHGDLSTAVALQLAQTLRQKPPEIAQRIAGALPAGDAFLEAVEVVPPGFLNFRLTAAALTTEMAHILATPETYGACDRGLGESVQVEFVSANPTGPLNVVSARAASVGDTLVRLLRTCGFAARSEFYVNDAGNQVDLLAESFAAADNRFLDELYASDAEKKLKALGERWFKDTRPQARWLLERYPVRAVLDEDPPPPAAP